MHGRMSYESADICLDYAEGLRHLMTPISITNLTIRECNMPLFPADSHGGARSNMLHTGSEV